MELLQLKYFLALSASEHLTRTAESLFITPSTLSVSISKLEKELGVPLFDRVGRNMHLNEYGEAFKKRVTAALDSLSDAKKEVQEMVGGRENQVMIALTSAAIWESSFSAFHASHPNIAISIQPFRQNVFTDESVDLFIQSSAVECPPGWTFTVLVDDDVLLAVPPDHPLAKRKTVDLRDTKDEWFIGSLHDSPFRRYTDELCRQVGFEPKCRLECDYMLRPRMCLSEKMLSITTGLGVNSGLYKDTAILQITNPPCKRPQAIYWRKARYLSHAAQELRDFLIEYYSHYDVKSYLKKGSRNFDAE